MNSPSTYLLDSFIEYANENKIDFSRAASIVSEYAKQRSAELTVESGLRRAELKLSQDVWSSPVENFIARIIVKTRVRYVYWTYRPEYHVISGPFHYWWCSIQFKKPNWKTRREKDDYFIDNLYYDTDWNQFWMQEPYLSDVPISKELYSEITKEKYESLKGTSFRKVNPELVNEFKKARKKVQDYSFKWMDSDLALRKPFYGSKGWDKRLNLMPPVLKRVRLK